MNWFAVFLFLGIVGGCILFSLALTWAALTHGMWVLLLGLGGFALCCALFVGWATR